MSGHTSYREHRSDESITVTNRVHGQLEQEQEQEQEGSLVAQVRNLVQGPQHQAAGTVRVLHLGVEQDLARRTWETLVRQRFQP